MNYIYTPREATLLAKVPHSLKMTEKLQAKMERMDMIAFTMDLPELERYAFEVLRSTLFFYENV